GPQRLRPTWPPTTGACWRCSRGASPRDPSRTEPTAPASPGQTRPPLLRLPSAGVVVQAMESRALSWLPTSQVGNSIHLIGDGRPSVKQDSRHLLFYRVTTRWRTPPAVT